MTECNHSPKWEAGNQLIAKQYQYYLKFCWKPCIGQDQKQRSLLLVTSDLRWMGPIDGKVAIGKLQVGSETNRLRAIDKGLI